MERVVSRALAHRVGRALASLDDAREDCPRTGLFHKRTLGTPARGGCATSRAHERAASKEAYAQHLLATGKATGTIRNFRATVARFLASGLDPIAYLAQRRGDISARSVYNEAVALRSWLRWRGEHEQVAAIRFPFPPLAPQPPFSDDDLCCLFDHATRRERDLCLLLLTTGMRAREVLTAQPMGDIARVMGKGGREGFVALPFPIDGVVPGSYQTLWRILHELGLRAGVHCTPRRFRTSHAHLLLRTNDLQTVQLALRHARITTTAIYTRWGAESRALEAQRRLAERIIGAL